MLHHRHDANAHGQNGFSSRLQHISADIKIAERYPCNRIEWCAADELSPLCSGTGKRLRAIGAIELDGLSYDNVSLPISAFFGNAGHECFHCHRLAAEAASSFNCAG